MEQVNYVFAECSSLISVVIPNSLTTIYTRCFRNCDCLEVVYYRGTVDEWNSIDFENIVEWGPINTNNSLEKATIYYYSDSDPRTQDLDDQYQYWHYVDCEIVVW